MFVALAVVLLLVAFVVSRSIQILKPGRAGLVERLGRYQRTLRPGLSLVLPGLDRVRQVDLRAYELVMSAEPLVARDDRLVLAAVRVEYVVRDPVRAAYEVADHDQAVQQLAVTTLRTVTGERDAEELLTSSGFATDSLLQVLRDGTGPWGLQILACQVTLSRHEGGERPRSELRLAQAHEL